MSGERWRRQNAGANDSFVSANRSEVVCSFRDGVYTYSDLLIWLRDSLSGIGRIQRSTQRKRALPPHILSDGASVPGWITRVHRLATASVTSSITPAHR